MTLRIRLAVLLLGLTALLLLWSTVASGVWYRQQITDTPAASTHPRIAVDTNGAIHVFWEEAGAILHQSLGPTAVGPEIVGDGGRFDLTFCPLCNEISVAWIGSDARPHYRAWRNGGWLDEVIFVQQTGPAVAVAAAHHGEGRILWVEPDDANGDAVVYFSEEEAGEWLWPLLLGRGNLSYPWVAACVGLRRADPDGRMVASWTDELGSPSGLSARTGEGLVWGEQEVVCDFFGGQFSVDTEWPAGVVHFAGNGPQPACPCNIVLYVTGTEGSWSEYEQIGTGHIVAEMEWPQQVALRVRQDDGVPFVAWRHESYELLQMFDERLILGCRLGTDWTWYDEIAVHRNAQNPDVAFAADGEPIVVWSDDSGGAFDIWIASMEPLAGVPGGSGPVSLSWEATPNPFSDRLSIRWSALDAGAPTLRVFDVQGREIATLAVGGGTVQTWIWDGTDRSGNLLPAGRYFLRWEAPGASSTRVVTILR